eukprot:gene8373-9840_t
MASSYLKLHSTSTLEALLTSQMQALAPNIQQFCLTSNANALSTINGRKSPLPVINDEMAASAQNGSMGMVDDTLVQFAVSIINYVCKSPEKFLAPVHALFSLLHRETLPVGESFPLELIKKIFFTKLVCPILANLKPVGYASPLTQKVYIEISKIISELVFDRNGIDTALTTPSSTTPMITPPSPLMLSPSPTLANLVTSSPSITARRGATVPASLQTQITDFITALVERKPSASSAGMQLADKSYEAYAYFVHYLKTESSQLDEFFKRAKEQGAPLGERNFYLYGIFKDLLNGLKSTSVGGIGMSGGGHQHALRGSPRDSSSLRVRANSSVDELHGTAQPPRYPQQKRDVIDLSKKWSSDDIKTSIHGRTQKRRAAVLERKASKTAVVTLHVHLSETSMVTRTIIVPLAATVRALAARLQADAELCDLTFSKDIADYEMAVRYSDSVTVIGDPSDANTREVLCEPELPLWMYDVDQETSLIFRAERKRNAAPFSIYLRCMFPSVPTPGPPAGATSSPHLAAVTGHAPVHPIIMFVSLQLTPGHIINEILLKHVIQLDPTRLGFFLYDLEEPSSSSSVPSSGSNVLVPQQIPNDRVLAGNKIGTMDILECNYRNAFEMSSVVDGTHMSLLLEQDLLVEVATQQLISTAHNHLHKNGIRSPRAEPSAYCLATVSAVNHFPAFLTPTNKLSQCNINLGDELIVIRRHFVALVDKFERRESSSLTSSSSSAKGGSAFFPDSAPVDEGVKYRFKITWVGPRSPESPHFQLSTVPSSPSTLTGVHNPPTASPVLTSFEKRYSIFFSNSLTNDPSLVASCRGSFCINNEVKLCIVGDEHPDKTNLFNTLRKASLSPSLDTPDMVADNCIKMSEWTYAPSESPDYLVAFKMFLFSGLDIYQSTHPLFISPESIFILTYQANQLNESTIEYWMEIIQAKSQGSLVYLVGVSNDDKRMQVMPSAKLARFTNIVEYVQLNLKNPKQVRNFINSVHATAKQKQFRAKVPIPYVVMRSQLLESSREARRTSRIPATSTTRIRSIVKTLGMEASQVDDALKYLLKCGDILFYKQDGDSEILTDVVFLDPLWMARLVASVFALKHQNGWLLMGGIHAAWDDRFLRAIQPSLIFLLEQFEIMHSNGGSLDSTSESDSIIVPVLFSEERPSVMRDLWPDHEPNKIQHERTYEFQFLPKGFFSRLSVRMLQNFDPVCIWQGGMVIQPAGQVWAGAAKNDQSQAFLAYDAVRYTLKMVVRDTATDCGGGQLLKSLVDILSSFIMWYFPDRLKTVFVTCTHCIKENSKDPSRFSLDYCEKEASFGHDSVKCGNFHVRLSDLAFEVTVHSNQFSIIPFEDLKVGPQLGAGSFATVYRGLWTGSDVAIKRLNVEEDDTATEKFREFRHEAQITGDLHHENILSLKGLGGQSIDTVVAKVSDFGLSIRQISKEVKGRKVWNWRWLAPEIIKNLQYTEKIDVYSYGMVIWELITRDVPFDEYFEELKWNSVIEDRIINGLRPTIPAECPEEFASLIRECWQDDPKKRPSFEEVINKITSMQSSFDLSSKLEFTRSIYQAVETPPSDYLSPHLSLNLENALNNDDSSQPASSSPTFSMNMPNTPKYLDKDFNNYSSEGSAWATHTGESQNNNPNTNSLGVVGSAHSSLSQAAEVVLQFNQFLPTTFSSTIHCLLYVHHKTDPQVWCGCGDGSITVINVNTKTVVTSNRYPDATRIIGMMLTKKSKKSQGPEEVQVWAYYSDGIMIYEPRQPSKPIKTIKATYLSFLLDDGKVILANCKEKVPCIKVYSKNKYKCKKTIPLKIPVDHQVSSFAVVSGYYDTKIWIGTEKGIIYVFDYPAMVTGLPILDAHTGTVHSIKRIGNLIWTSSEKQICIFDEQCNLKKKIDGISSRVLNLHRYEQHSHQLVQQLGKKHTDAISHLVDVHSMDSDELWASSWDKKISTYNLTTDIDTSKCDLNSNGSTSSSPTSSLSSLPPGLISPLSLFGETNSNSPSPQLSAISSGGMSTKSRRPPVSPKGKLSKLFE